MSNHDHIDRHLSANEMQDYRSGNLSGLESNKIERHLLVCSFCAEALEGLESSGSQGSFLSDVDQLKQKIRSRVGDKKVIRLWNTPVKIAAAVVVIAISTLAVLMNLDRLQESQPAEIALGLTDPKEEEEISEPEVIEEPQVITGNKKEELETEIPKQVITKASPAKEEIATTLETLATIEETEADEVAAGEGFAAIEELAEEEVTLDLAMEDIEFLVLDTIKPANLIAEKTLNEEVNTTPAPLALNALAEEKIDKAKADVEVLEESRAKVSRRSAKKNQVAAAFEAEEELTIDPAPEIGFDDYTEYLNENLKYPKEAMENNIKGIVVIILLVQEDGSLVDFDVNQSLGFGCDEEAIRLIKDGPAWNPGRRNNINIPKSVEVKVRFEFEK